ncbi:MAG: hypothetical protein IKL73_02870 [Lachnospiraceae bacterium]|nr:hypothetical protein [Lachnospira sp.]MBR6697197.1 hypothetical protein [Lachnospiraceae bacterium]
MDNYNNYNNYNQRTTQYAQEQKVKKTKKEKKKDKKRRKRAIIIIIIILLALLLAFLIKKFGFGGGNGFGLGKGDKDGNGDGQGTTTVAQQSTTEYQTKADEGHLIKIDADKVTFKGVEYTQATVNNLKTVLAAEYTSGDKVTLEMTSTARDTLITEVKTMLTGMGITPTEKDI